MISSENKKASMNPVSSQATKITCPDCGTEINVSDVLRQQVEGSITRQIQEQFAGQKRDLDATRQALEKQQDELESQRSHQQEAIRLAINEGLSKEKKLLQHIWIDTLVIRVILELIERSPLSPMESLEIF